MTDPSTLRPAGRFFGALAAVAVTLGAADASAGGLEFPDLGTVAIGRGTAFVAKADTPLAFHYNPAGLSKQRRGSILLSANLVQLSVSYTRSGSDRCLILDDMGNCAGGFDPALDYSMTRGVDADGNPFFDPSATNPYDQVSFSGIGPAPVFVANWTGIGKAKGLSLSFGLLPPSSFGTPKYPNDGPQRYMLRQAHILALFPGVGIAYNVNRYFQIGAVFLSGMTFVEVEQAARLSVNPNNGLTRNEDLGGDAVFKLKTKDLFMPSGIIGVLSNPADFLEIGASVRLPAMIRARGKVELTAPVSEEQDAEIVGDDTVELRQHFPWVVRAGVRYIHRFFDIEADFVYENWSSLDAFKVDFVTCPSGKGGGLSAKEGEPCTQVMTAGGPVPLDDAAIPKNYRDTYSVRLGSDFALWPGHLTGRVGVFYQTSTFPKNYDTMNLDFPFGGEQVGVGGGLTWRVNQYFDLTAGYQHVFQRTVKVTQGIVQQATNLVDGPDGEPISPGNTVNNGTYEVALNLFGMSFLGRF